MCTWVYQMLLQICNRGHATIWLGFDVKYRPQAPVLNAWFPAGAAILGDSENVRR
jgi:hypothetical protein